MKRKKQQKIKETSIISTNSIYAAAYSSLNVRSVFFRNIFHVHWHSFLLNENEKNRAYKKERTQNSKNQIHRIERTMNEWNIYTENQ